MPKKKSKKGKARKIPDQVSQVSPNVVADPNSSGNSSILLSTLYGVNQMKICRLCESKNGPFLNIFADLELELSKKIDDLLPFEIKEEDDLPHKVCFRCTAKIEELYQFVQKCITSQENLQKMLGKANTYIEKPKPQKRKWEDTSSKTDMTKNDLCDSIIQKAMERIKVLQPNLEVSAAKNPKIQNNLSELTIKKVVQPAIVEDTEVRDEVGESQYTTRSMTNQIKKPSPKKKPLRKAKISVEVDDPEPKAPVIIEKPTIRIKTEPTNSTKTTEFGVEQTSSAFNIMEHVSIIKVNGVGTLFQCKFCDRNFLSRESVMSHGCAKTGALKVQSLAKSFNTDQTSGTENKVVQSRPKPGPARFKQGNSDNQSVITKITSSDNKNTASLNVLKLSSKSNNTYSINDKNLSNSLTIRKVNVAQSKDQNTSNGEVQPFTDTEASNQSQPYPVGLFRAAPSANNAYSTPNHTYPTPAMKKQSYQVLQTSNPSKLLISSRAVAGPKSVKQRSDNEKQAFAFVNLDTTEQPSYVLPTDNIVPETKKNAPETCTSELYTCNICSVSFSREKKLLAHVQDHFDEMDAEVDKDTSRSKGRRRV